METPNKIEHIILSVDRPKFDALKRKDIIAHLHAKEIHEDKWTGKLVKNMTLHALKVMAVLQCRKEWSELSVDYPKSAWLQNTTAS